MNPGRPDWLARLYAHRGLHGPGVAENSLAAFRGAVAGGYGIELDIQLSADGEAMVFHDETLDRMTAESGLVGERTADALRRLPLLGTAETIPTLAEVLTTVAGATPLMVEIKDAAARYEATDGRAEARAAELLADYEGPVSVCSFNPATLLWFRENAPAIPRGLTSYDFEDESSLPAERRKALAGLADLDRVAASFVSYEWRGVGSAPVQAARARGLPVTAWTLRSAELAEQTAPYCDGLIFEGFTPDDSL